MLHFLANLPRCARKPEREHGTRILLVTPLTVADLTAERNLDASTTAHVFAETFPVEALRERFSFIYLAREFKYLLKFYAFLSKAAH